MEQAGGVLLSWLLSKLVIGWIDNTAYEFHSRFKAWASATAWVCVSFLCMLHKNIYSFVLCLTDGQQPLVSRSCSVGGKRGGRWRRARPRISGDPQSKWSTKATGTPEQWYMSRLLNHVSVECIKKASAEAVSYLRKFSYLLFSESWMKRSVVPLSRICIWSWYREAFS